jgi:NAD(P)H-dependent FMN reductase
MKQQIMIKELEMNVSLIYGSVRSDRQGINAARYLERKLRERHVGVNFIDPLEFKLPLLDRMYKQFKPGEAPESMQKLAQLLNNSDGFLLVSGEYNHSIPPAMKNLLDHYQPEYFFKPSAIASYSAGRFGGVRAAVHLRVIAGELGMPSISFMLSFPQIGKFFDENLVPVNQRAEASTARFLDEFIWYLKAFKKQRAEGTPY